MERELQIVETLVKLITVLKRPVTAWKELLQVDIYAIGATSFCQNLKQIRTVAFATSLYEID